MNLLCYLFVAITKVAITRVAITRAAKNLRDLHHNLAVAKNERTKNITFPQDLLSYKMFCFEC